MVFQDFCPVGQGRLPRSLASFRRTKEVAMGCFQLEWMVTMVSRRFNKTTGSSLIVHCSTLAEKLLGFLCCY